MSQFKCSVCGKYFKYEKSVMKHGRDFHKRRVEEVKAIPVPVDNEMSEADYLIEQRWGL